MWLKRNNYHRVFCIVSSSSSFSLDDWDYINTQFEKCIQNIESKVAFFKLFSLNLLCKFQRFIILVGSLQPNWNDGSFV